MRRRVRGGEIDEAKLADSRVETWTTGDERARLDVLCRAARTVDDVTATVTAEFGPAAASGATYLPSLWVKGLDVVDRDRCARWAAR